MPPRDELPYNERQTHDYKWREEDENQPPQPGCIGSRRFAASDIGATDDIGYFAVEDRMHIHDFHATVLHLMGLDHTRLTYNYSGRDFRLTDVAGVVAKKIIT